MHETDSAVTESGEKYYVCKFKADPTFFILERSVVCSQGTFRTDAF